MNIKCPHCSQDFLLEVPDIMPRPLGGPRLGPRHVAVRFGDMRRTVNLNGEEVSDLCIEAMEGDPGWAALRPNRKTVAPYIAVGRVTLGYVKGYKA